MADPEYSSMKRLDGEFWAVLNNDTENAGDTLHFVGKGIDTGGIITQVSIHVVANDTLGTLAAKQGYASVEILVSFIQHTALPYQSVPVIERDKNTSRLWYSLTLRQYLRFKKIIK
jgi:folate-dependent phosphoribosylglycinamide formyltransferase PurN